MNNQTKSKHCDSSAKEENVKSMAVEWEDWPHPKVYANLIAWELPA